jgi:hypothetical protein
MSKIGVLTIETIDKISSAACTMATLIPASSLGWLTSTSRSAMGR